MPIWMIVFITAFGAAASTSHAQESLSAVDMQRLSAQPGVEINHRIDGSSNVTTWTRNGVTIERKEDGSNITISGNDNTGKGAVICNWMIDVSVRAALELCPSEHFAELRRDLDESIAAIDAFIVSNSFTTVNLDQLHARETMQYNRTREITKNKIADRPKLCSTGDTGQIISYMNKMSQEQRRKAVRDLLSIPRWPVSNPCL